MAYAPFVDEGAYTLDSGDRLRIVVFGQEGLTNSYAVDASGHIAMPLIGSVLARGATTDELSRRIAEKLRQGYIREPHTSRSRSRPIARSSSSARSPSRANAHMLRT
jgi:polysaccharide biosynthesis/export protein